MVDEKDIEQEDIKAALQRETQDGPGNLDGLPDGDFAGEDNDG